MSSLGKVFDSSEMFPQTDIWMDSFTVKDHKYGLEHGAVGVTTSPTWVSDMLNEELEAQTPFIRELAKKYPEKNEIELLWQFTLDMAHERSNIMLPLFESAGPKKGRFSVQVNIYDYMNADKMVEMALQVHAQNKNMQVKIPSTTAGIKAIEEATYRGVSCMATLCVSVSQYIAVAEAVERAFARREAEGLSNDMLNPVCAVLNGGEELWLEGYLNKHEIAIDPDAVSWCGVAILKKSYEFYKARGYHTRLLSAYYRNIRHWQEFIGGDVIMTIPADWQRRFAKTDIEIRDYMSDPIPADKLAALLTLPTFQKAYAEDGLSVEEFTSYEPVVCIIRFFMEVYQRAVFQVRDIMLPDPKL